MSSPLAQVSAPYWNARADAQRGRGAGEVKGYWGSVEEREREGCLSSGGVPVEGYLRGLECCEQNRSYRGHGLRMLWGQATFDSTGGYGLEDTEYIYTLKYTHTQRQLLLSARFIAHLEFGVFSSGRKASFFFCSVWSFHKAVLGIIWYELYNADTYITKEGEEDNERNNTFISFSVKFLTRCFKVTMKWQ